MIITIHQPEYLPWLGFFNRIYKSDVFVILDNVQYQKNGFINRNRIKTAKGETWMTVPVKGDQKSSDINKVELFSSYSWGLKHWDLIESSYDKAPYFGEYAFLFKEAILKRNFKIISELDYYFIRIVLDILGIKREIIKSSSLGAVGAATDLIVDICKKLDGDIYLAGPGGKNYMDLGKFEESGIGVIFDDFKHPEYQQLFPEHGFLPYMSIIDLLFNCGPKSLGIIKNNQDTRNNNQTNLNN